jgi:hypothetical protein
MMRRMQKVINNSFTDEKRCLKVKNQQKKAWDVRLVEKRYAYRSILNKIVVIDNPYLFRENRDEYIKNTMRDNMQLFVNALWQVC